MRCPPLGAGIPDFKANYRLNIPEGFNFAYDVIDGWAEQDPDKPALLQRYSMSWGMSW